MGYEILGSITPDKLIGGPEVELLTRKVTILSGQGALKRGSVIGLITLAAGAPSAKAGNTGNGVIADVALKSKAKLGTYTLKCTAAAADAGTFAVYDPDGNRMADATVAVAYVSNQINFTIGDGAADFIVGDELYIPVAAGSGKGKLCDKANVDGSQFAKCILAFDVDATAADADAVAFKTGLFNRDALIVAAANTVAEHEEELRNVGIFLNDSLSY